MLLIHITIRLPATAGSNAGTPRKFAAIPVGRLNINGVINCRDLSAIVRYYDTINAHSTIKSQAQVIGVDWSEAKPRGVFYVYQEYSVPNRTIDA
jgi:hypothetical protein